MADINNKEGMQQKMKVVKQIKINFKQDANREILFGVLVRIKVGWVCLYCEEKFGGRGWGEGGGEGEKFYKPITEGKQK